MSASITGGGGDGKCTIEARVDETAEVVVVGTRGDPATPIAWARGLAAQLGSGRLVTVDDTTHTASLNGNECLDSILIRYLLDLDTPPPGASC